LAARGAFDSSARASLDHLVGTSEEGRRHFQAKRLGGLQIDDEIELGRLLDREVSGLCSAHNLVDIFGGALSQAGGWAASHHGGRRADG
jgi:hypothetical protein